MAFGSAGCDRVARGTVAIRSVAVPPSRRLAWICVSRGSTAARVEVHRFDASRAAVLDAADSLSVPDSITATSLAISRAGSAVYWARGATPYMAPLG